MNRGPKVKREHYVPRFYLRRFADARGQLAVFDKKEMRTFSSPVEGVAAERDFFSFHEMAGLGAPEQFIESDFLPSYEEAGAAAIRDLIDSLDKASSQKLKEAVRHDLAIFTAIQSVRTLEFREQAVEFSLALTRSTFREFVRAKFPEHADAEVEFTQTDAQKRAMHARLLLDPAFIEDLAVILNAHIWIVGRSEGGGALWTSDNPVARCPHLATPKRSRSGLRSPGIEIAYPLDPDTVLILLERSHFRQLAGNDGKAVRLSSAQVARYNLLQVRDSTRFLFSPSTDFPLAEQLCRDDGSLRDRKGRRIKSANLPENILHLRS